MLRGRFTARSVLNITCTAIPQLFHKVPRRTILTNQIHFDDNQSLMVHRRGRGVQSSVGMTRLMGWRSG